MMSKPNRKRSAAVTPLRPAQNAEQQTGEPITYTARVGGMDARGAAALVCLVAAHLRNVTRYEMAWDAGLPTFRLTIVPTTSYPVERIRADWQRVLAALGGLYPTPPGNSQKKLESSTTDTKATECPPLSSPPASEA